MGHGTGFRNWTLTNAAIFWLMKARYTLAYPLRSSGTIGQRIARRVPMPVWRQSRPRYSSASSAACSDNPMTHIERRETVGKKSKYGADVRDGELLDWSDRGIPENVRAYRQPDGRVALSNGKGHVCGTDAQLVGRGLAAALRNLGSCY